MDYVQVPKEDPVSSIELESEVIAMERKASQPDEKKTSLDEKGTKTRVHKHLAKQISLTTDYDSEGKKGD
jgi:hypothetical protein